MIPPSWPGLSVQSLRVGQETAAVSATRDGACFTTRVAAPPGLHRRIGQILPLGSVVDTITLDGESATYTSTQTPRGCVVEVETTTDRDRPLVITRAR